MLTIPIIFPETMNTPLNQVHMFATSHKTTQQYTSVFIGIHVADGSCG